MAEWLKAHAWKACLGETLTWVRIPLSPPFFFPHKHSVLRSTLYFVLASLSKDANGTIAEEGPLGPLTEDEKDTLSLELTQAPRQTKATRLQFLSGTRQAANIVAMSFIRRAAAVSICDGAATVCSTAARRECVPGRKLREKKQDLENQLSGHPTAPEAEKETREIQACIDLFIQDKKNQGLSAKVIGKYTRELSRLRIFCERNHVYTIQSLTRELLTGFCATCPQLYPSTYTRTKVRERIRSFLRCCYQAQWLPRVPELPKIKIDEPPTMPLSDAE